MAVYCAKHMENFSQKGWQSADFSALNLAVRNGNHEVSKVNSLCWFIRKFLRSSNDIIACIWFLRAYELWLDRESEHMLEEKHSFQSGWLDFRQWTKTNRNYSLLTLLHSLLFKLQTVRPRIPKLCSNCICGFTVITLAPQSTLFDHPSLCPYGQVKQ